MPGAPGESEVQLPAKGRAQRVPAAGYRLGGKTRAAGAKILVLFSSHPHSVVVNGQQRRRFQHNSTPPKQSGVGACRRGALRAIHWISTPKKFCVVHELFDKKQKVIFPIFPGRFPDQLAEKTTLEPS